MKSSRVILALGTVALAVCSSCTTNTASESATVTDAPVPGAINLQVVMTIPPTWHPMLEDRTEDAFISHLSDVFRRDGFRGNVVDVRSPDQANPNYPVLNIHLTEWRMDPTGNIQCTFGATVQSPRGMKQLGTFNGMAIRWMQSPGRFGLADTYSAAADDALRQLYASIARTDLVAGFTAR